MASFSLQNEYFQRIIDFCNFSRTSGQEISCNSANSDSLLQICYGDREIFIPTEFCIIFSSKIYQMVISERTINSIDLKSLHKHEFRNKENEERIMNLLKDNSYVVENMSNEDILDFFEFGLDIGCTYFMIPLFEKFSNESNKDCSNETIESLLSNITYKSLIIEYFNKQKKFIYNFPLKQNITYESELDYVIKNFNKIIKSDFFFKWCLEKANINILEQIFSHNNLCLDSEDSFLNFILNLCKKDSSFVHLLSYVYIEYCSIECVKTLIEYIDERLSQNYEKCESEFFIKCLSRRCLKLNNGISLPILKERHKEIKEKEHKCLLDVKYDSNNPKRGIFNIEYEKNNVDLTASSNYNPNNPKRRLEDLFQLKDDYSFETKNESYSWIKASLKDKKYFTINKYMIRGNWNNGTEQLKSWTLKGQLYSSKEWVEIDSHNNETEFKKYEIRTFDVNTKEKFIAVQLYQTGPNYNNNYWFNISGFDVYGQIYE